MGQQKDHCSRRALWESGRSASGSGALCSRACTPLPEIGPQVGLGPLWSVTPPPIPPLCCWRRPTSHSDCAALPESRLAPAASTEELGGLAHRTLSHLGRFCRHDSLSAFFRGGSLWPELGGQSKNPDRRAADPADPRLSMAHCQLGRGAWVCPCGRRVHGGPRLLGEVSHRLLPGPFAPGV